MYVLKNPLMNFVEIYDVNVDSKMSENFKEAIDYEEKENWIKAIETELNAVVQKEVFETVNRREINGKPVAAKCVV